MGKKSFLAIFIITLLGYALFNAYQCVYEKLMVRIVGKEIYNSLSFHIVVSILLTIFVYYLVINISKLKFATFGFKEF